jgi:adenylylsulfate kinase
MSKNTVWQKSLVHKEDKEKMNGHKAVLLWLTGLPCAGKSTLAIHCERFLFDRNIQVAVLDGDNVRHGLNKNLGFTPQDRSENIRRVGEVGKLFVDNGMIVLAAFVSPYRKDRDAVRSRFDQGEFIEIYVQAPLQTCQNRDVKGFYKKALEGTLANFTGISDPYEEPTRPEITVNTDRFSINESVQQIIDYLILKKYIK